MNNPILRPSGCKAGRGSPSVLSRPEIRPRRSRLHSHRVLAELSADLDYLRFKRSAGERLAPAELAALEASDAPGAGGEPC